MPGLNPHAFPSSKELARIKTENEYFLLYQSQVYDTDTKKGVFRLKEFFSGDRDKKEILGIALNLPSLVINAGVDFLFGEPIKVKCSDETVQKEIDEIMEYTDFQTTLEQSAILLQDVGHTQLAVRRIDAADGTKVVIEEIPYDMYFPDWSSVPVGQKPGTIRLASYITVARPGDISLCYIYVQEHTAGKIEHSLWKESSKQITEQVPLTTVPGLLDQLGITSYNVEAAGGVMSVTDDTGLTYVPIFQVNTRKTVKDRSGMSILNAVMPLLEEVNDRITQISLQFLKHLNPPIQIPKGAVKQNKDGTVNRKSLEVLLMETDWPDAKYVTNDNPLIESAFKHIDSLIDKIADLTQTPRTFMRPAEVGGVESAESLKTRFMSFFKRIRKYQTAYDPQIKKVLLAALELKGVQVPKEMTIEIQYDEGLPRNKTTEVSYYQMAHDAGLISLERAVAGLQGLEGDVLEEEITAIEEEKASQPVFDFSGGGGFNGSRTNPDLNAPPTKKKEESAPDVK